MSEKPRIVIDSQVLLRAVINRRSLSGSLVFELADRYTLLISEAMLQEIEDVLSRPAIRKKYSFSDAIINELVARLSHGEAINITDVPAVSRDPKDDIFLACAEIGKATYIVSEDLLVLNPYKNIAILPTLDVVKMLRASDNPSTS